ncbi:MAG: hypothetical protein R2825_02050 [Saprospiraceae bacterium]
MPISSAPTEGRVAHRPGRVEDTDGQLKCLSASSERTEVNARVKIFVNDENFVTGSGQINAPKTVNIRRDAVGVYGYQGDEFAAFHLLK